MVGKDSFVVHHSLLKSIEPLNDAERGRLFTAMLEYSITGVAPELRGNERFIFPTSKLQIDDNNEKYIKRCEENRANGALGGKANATNRKRPLPNAPQTPPDKDKDKDLDKDSIGQGLSARDTRNSRFAPPSLEEVAEYCRERKNKVDPQRFVSFYAAKGWMIGKNKMQDWKAAVHTWEQRDKAEKSGNGTESSLDLDEIEDMIRKGLFN